MIRIGNLHIKNVGPFEEQKFEFDFEDGHPNIHIFTGANGTGKTTILHALANPFDFIQTGHYTQKTNNFYKKFHYFGQFSKTVPKISRKPEKNESHNSFCEVFLIDKDYTSYLERTTTYGCNCNKIHTRTLSEQLEDDKKSSETLKSFGMKSFYKPSEETDAILEFRNSILNKDISKQNLKFAAFGYSGYRMITSTQIGSMEEEEYNPLALALEFEKKIDERNNISNWIVNRYSKAAIEETHGNKELANKYRTALNCLMKSIEELTDGEFTFAIKTNPWQVVTKYHGNEVEFDVLPDGLRSILSWMGDLLMRLDQIPWENNDIPVNEQDIILFLDEIEVHLHPKWQYRILPLTQTIFPNAQIFITTHSPFIINSIENAKIYQLETEEGVSKLKKVSLSNTGDSYQYIYEEILGVTKRFGVKTEMNLKRFNEIDSEIVQGNFERETEFKKVIESLADEGEEVTALISSKLFRLKRVVGKDYLPA